MQLLSNADCMWHGCNGAILHANTSLAVKELQATYAGTGSRYVMLVLASVVLTWLGGNIACCTKPWHSVPRLDIIRAWGGGRTRYAQNPTDNGWSRAVDAAVQGMLRTQQTMGGAGR
jgi:hypothetical protein